MPCIAIARVTSCRVTTGRACSRRISVCKTIHANRVAIGCLVSISKTPVAVVRSVQAGVEIEIEVAALRTKVVLTLSKPDLCVICGRSIFAHQALHLIRKIKNPGIIKGKTICSSAVVEPCFVHVTFQVDKLCQ